VNESEPVYPGDGVYLPLEQFDATVALPCAGVLAMAQVTVSPLSGSVTDGAHDACWPLIVASERSDADGGASTVALTVAGGESAPWLSVAL
jgi:hypothetical protein